MKRLNLGAFYTLLALIKFLGFSSFAQETVIKGSVFSADSSGGPIAGAVVQIVGTNYFAVTDGNGIFTLKGHVSESPILLISSLGYNPTRISANKSGAIENVYLSVSTPLLKEALVVSNGREAIEHPGSVHVIDAQSLNRFQYTDINRVLREVPGVNLQEEDGFGLRPNIGLRGTGVERSSKICIMEDGILVAPAPYADPAAYYFPTAGRMNSVEVIKGSSQIKYGPFTTGGAINFVSTPVPEELSGKISSSIGAYGTKQVHAHAGKSFKHFGILAETFQYGSDGFKHLEQNQKTGFAKQDYLLKMVVRSDPAKANKHSLLLKGGSTTEQSNETYLGLSKSDYEKDPFRRYQASMKDQMNTEQIQLSAHYQGTFKTGTRLNAIAYQQKFYRNWYRLDNILDSSGKRIPIATLVNEANAGSYAYQVMNGLTSAPNALSVKANNRNYALRGAQLSIHQDFNTGIFKQASEAGVRVHEDEADRFQWQDDYTMQNGMMMLSKSGTHGTESNRIESSEALSAYVQHQIRYKSVSFYPGIRYENILTARKDYGKLDPSRSGSTLVERSNRTEAWLPGAALSWFVYNQLNIFIGAHKGFSPAGSAPGAKPEESMNYEAGIKGSHSVMQWQLILFYNDYSNLLGADLAAGGGAGTGDLFNAGKSEIKGIEFFMNGNLAAHLQLNRISFPYSVSYTFTQGNFSNSFTSTFPDWSVVKAGDEIPYIATHQAAVFLGAEYEKVSLNLNFRYQDDMRIAPGTGPLQADAYIPAWFVTDLTLSLTLVPQLRLFGGVTNLFDERYVVSQRPAGYRPGLPRMVSAGACFRF